ncbi:hypothetical protein NEF87_000799 [Candidatus Lokiarchaeum ossiferum]|uniref:2-oxoacid dehydrogenase acyltransferase catalytic domain-containing protein n=1 Tax=Candidatus Lokiarchaeum ossiferum TaxID=2951803 RepID=A0ABY6HLY3_9ARCH|nr:hypothetical protein NEF87_000799 [Candidatus Lokiarchaeum sp. B-35]
MKKSHSTSYTTIPWPKIRTFVTDYLEMGMKKHNVHGYGEINVTVPKSIIKTIYAETNEKISFTAYFVHSLAKAVGEHKMMHAMKRKNKLVIFDDVDVVTIIERDINGMKYPQSHIIRKADKKTLREINDEIRSVQQNPSPQNGFKKLDKFVQLPRFIRRMLWRYLMNHPKKQKESMGTVGVSSIGMFSRQKGWGIPIALPTLSFTLGGIYQKKFSSRDSKHNSQFENQLCYTMTVDHDIIDGAPAARFVTRLSNIIEDAESLQTISTKMIVPNFFVK